MEEEKKEFEIEKVKKQVEESINKIIQEGIQPGNVELLYKYIDIHKDIANEEYWDKKKEVMEMNYRNYGENYNEGYENYGRRGVPGSGRGNRRYSRRGGNRGYQGDEAMEEMYGAYQEYSEGRERYGHHPATMKSLDYMLKSVVDFIEMLKEDAGSQEEIELIQKYTQEISDM